MARIEIDYVELKNNYKYVNDTINELLTIVENIDKSCNALCNRGYWEGTLSTSFNSFKTKMNSNVVQDILKLKETEEYKNIYMTSFKDLENSSSKDYV